MTTRKGGRPSRISPARIQRFLESIAGGQYIDVSARMAGINPSTVHRWETYGREQVIAVEEGDSVIAEWLDGFKDDFKADNPMWVMDPPEGFEPDRWIYALFLHRFEKAKAVAEAAALGNIRAAARAGSWQADAWYLERTRPDKYGRKIVAEHQGSASGPPVKVETVDPEALMNKLAGLAAQLGEEKQ